MCAIFGLIDFNKVLTKENREEIIKVLSRKCMERGTHATGISYMRNGELTIYKRPKKASKMKFRLSSESNVIMGHTRHTTQGSEKLNFNNHPFKGSVDGLDFAFAHNGMLYNDSTLRAIEKLPITNIETDSYVAVQLIEKEKTLNFDSLKEMAVKVKGSFCFTAMDSMSNLYIIKGDNPICMVKFKSGFYIYASTPEILSRTLLGLRWLEMDFEKITIKQGDIVKIDALGEVTKDYFEKSYLHNSYSHAHYYNEFFEYDESEYQAVKSVANLFGYTEEDVDLMIEEGYGPDEIEEYIYEGYK